MAWEGGWEHESGRQVQAISEGEKNDLQGLALLCPVISFLGGELEGN